MVKNYSFCFSHFSLNFLKTQNIDDKNRGSKEKILKNRLVMSSENIRRRKFMDLNSIKFAQEIIKRKNPVLASDLTQTETPYSVFETKSGLKIVDFKEGNGENITWGSFPKLNYTSYIKIGENILKIDSTYDRKQSFTYQHGNGEVNLAFEEAVHAMKIGGKRRVIVKINSEKEILNKGPISPSSGIRQELTLLCKNNLRSSELFLIFDIELLDILYTNF